MGGTVARHPQPEWQLRSKAKFRFGPKAAVDIAKKRTLCKHERASVSPWFGSLKQSKRDLLVADQNRCAGR